MATLTAAGINCSNGTLDGQYTGTSETNTSFPIGSYVFAIGNPGGSSGYFAMNATIQYLKTVAGTRAIGVSGQSSLPPYVNLAGTWRNRGFQPDGCIGGTAYALCQRVA